MNRALEHWHPILLSAELKAKPKMVRLHDKEIVLFRNESGAVGAMEDKCPHRRMRLSLGRIEGERLVCAYHGWSYSTDGRGRSPGNPDLEICADYFEVEERHGAIWIRPQVSEADFPELDHEGFDYVATQHYRIDAPMELVLDNFTEVEHTGTTHAMLGYDPTRMPEVSVEIESSDDRVRVINEGPQKHLPWLVEKLFGARTGDIFVDDWTTYFSPVFTQYEHWWKDPATGESRPEHLRTFVFFVPESTEVTQLFVLAYARSGRWGAFAQKYFLTPIIKRLLKLEVELDIGIIESIADKDPQLSGMRLSRFDRVLGLNRSRISSIYRRDDSDLNAGTP